MSSDSFIQVDEPSSATNADFPDKQSCEIVWEMPNFSSSVTVNGQDHFSPSFFPKDNPKHRWFVGMRVVGSEEEYAEIFLKPDFVQSLPQSGSCYFNYLLSVENANLHRLAEWNVESTITSEQDRTYHRVKRSHIQANLVQDELMIRAEVTFQLTSGDNKANNFRKNISLGSSSKLLGDLSPMLGSETFSDVVISVEDGGTLHNIPAHQVLLASRSPFFHAKLTQDTPESRDRCIKITNSDLATVRNMLAYIYTDQFNNNLATEQAIKLLKCAEKYSITGLKSLCEVHLIRSVNSSNVFDVLAAADLFNARELKAKSLAIVCNSRKNISRIKEALSSTLVEMTQEQRLTLLTEIVIEVSSKLHQN